MVLAFFCTKRWYPLTSAADESQAQLVPPSSFAHTQGK
jgi:hypothetical protein